VATGGCPLFVGLSQVTRSPSSACVIPYYAAHEAREDKEGKLPGSEYLPSPEQSVLPQLGEEAGTLRFRLKLDPSPSLYRVRFPYATPSPTQPNRRPTTPP
jgi:hypothetical protein